MKDLKLLSLVFAILLISCGSEDDMVVQLPSVTTATVSGVGNTTAGCGGNVTQDGGNPVTARGVVWKTSENPTVADNKTTDGSGTGEFISLLTNLEPGTTYYIRAYATSSAGTSYGAQFSFTTTNLPAAGTFIEYELDIVTDREGNTAVSTGGATTCLFVDGVFFDMDPYAVSYSVLFYDMARSMPGTVTTYPADFEHSFPADAGSEIFNGPSGSQVLTNWYNVNSGYRVTRFTAEHKLFVYASWCTTGGCEFDDCYLVTGKARVRVNY